MRILLVHPEDSPRTGAWSQQRWDLLVDLGQSAEFSQREWIRSYRCPVLSAASFRRGAADAREVKQTFSAGRGYLIDHEGIDHWDLTAISMVQEAATILAFRRLVDEMPKSDEIWCTRSHWPSNILPILLDRPVRTFDHGRSARASAAASHYAEVIRRFSAGQIREILLDKYDSGYRWRSHFTRKHKSCSEPVVLVPSAYQNVSRTAAAYAELLPSQSFLLVATRRSAHQFTPPKNLQSRNLAEYVRKQVSTAEIVSLVERWASLRRDLYSSEVFRILFQSGHLDSFGSWLRDGVYARNAWSELLNREPVCGVLCGDDTNRFTRLPVLLARKRNIATADFHHGALDGHYLLKDLPSDIYLAKSEMERDYLLRVCGFPAEKVVTAPPVGGNVRTSMTNRRTGHSIVLFSEPYEAAGLRPDEVYGELLPALWSLARESGRGLTIKLHPFESRSQRIRLLNAVLPAAAAKQVRVIDGPLTNELLGQTWCGITVESSTVIDCLRNGVCCFLCGWLTMSPYEYVRQYVRFGIGEVLQNVDQIREIPQLLSGFQNCPGMAICSAATDPALLQQWLTSRHREPCIARSGS